MTVMTHILQDTRVQNGQNLNRFLFPILVILIYKFLEELRSVVESFIGQYRREIVKTIRDLWLECTEFYCE